MMFKHWPPLNVLRGFGNVKVLSNPSVRVRNGSPAYLSVGSNIRYVTKSTSNFSNSGGGSAYNQSTDIQTDSLFSGVVIGVAPIVHDNGGVELLVHPMQTEVVPRLRKPSWLAAALERSMMRLPW